jgi:hypothetical protein
VEKEFQK